ncbi:hypothetical protein BCR44DRAFT_1482098 [Catenaria anguillulae PL171]|uniref:Uncharacterized protein n=1 Tax=Catenaria anguillulae PL171 TaxID=765915 RepID=A0A1Y2I2K9_9FUNG|nr:hypothetical protein BCR44DRAFT_1482098 [Catenaria anguillulae PL171]
MAPTSTDASGPNLADTGPALKPSGGSQSLNNKDRPAGSARHLQFAGTGDGGGSRIGSRAASRTDINGSGSMHGSAMGLDRFWGGSAGGRRIVAEDSQWNLATVEALTTTCVNAIVNRFEERPILKGLPPKYRAKVLAAVSVDIPLAKIVTVIDDDPPHHAGALRAGYWQRRSAAHYPDAELTRHGGSWKRLYCERTLERELATFVPGCGKEFALAQLMKLLAPCIVKLHVTQLQPDASTSDPAERRATDPNPDHLNPMLLVEQLERLKEVALYYGVLDLGMKFQWWLFGMTASDSLNLARALLKCQWTHLTLSRCQIDDAKMVTLCEGLRDHRYLEVLKLDNNKIGDEGAQSLSAVLVTPKCVLNSIDLGNNRIGALGAAHLAKSIQQFKRYGRQLQSLILRLNPLGNDGAFVIAYALQPPEDHHQTVPLNDRSVTPAPPALTIIKLDLSATSMGPSSLEQCLTLITDDLVQEIDLSCNAFVSNDPDVMAAAAAAAAAASGPASAGGSGGADAVGTVWEPCQRRQRPSGIGWWSRWARRCGRVCRHPRG